MSVDPISLTIALTSLFLGITSYIRSSKCSNCLEIEMKTNEIDIKGSDVEIKTIK